MRKLRTGAAIMSLWLMVAVAVSCSTSPPPPAQTEKPATPTLGPTATPALAVSPPSLLASPSPTPAAPFPTFLPRPAKEVTLEEASKALGVTIPLPTYLPLGLSLRRVFLVLADPSPPHVNLLFSDRDIAGKASTDVELWDLQKSVPLAIAVQTIDPSGFPSPFALDHTLRLSKGQTKVINFGDFKSVLQLQLSSALGHLTQPGLSFWFTPVGGGRVSEALTEDDIIKIAGSIPVVVMPSFRLGPVTVAEASKVFTAPLPTPGYVPPGFALQGVYTPGNSRRAILIFARAPLAESIETLPDIMNLWDKISRGEESSPAIILQIFQGSNWSLGAAQWNVLQLGGRVVQIGAIPAFAEDAPYHYLQWGFPAANGKQVPEGFSISLAASASIPEEELVALGESLLR